MAGRTVDNVEELEVLTYDGLRLRVCATTGTELGGIVAEGGRRGDIYRRLAGLRDRYGDVVRARYPEIPRRVSGDSVRYGRRPARAGQASTRAASGTGPCASSQAARWAVT